MKRTEYTESERTPLSVCKEAIYISENLGDNQTFQGIIDKYKNYRFTEHIDSIREEFECQSSSHIVFGIRFEIGENFSLFLLFSAKLDIPNRNEIDYEFYPISNETDYEESTVNDMLINNLYDRV